MTQKIITLTVNPAVDKSTKFAGIIPEQKIRCEKPQFDAGGGGINVSKAIKRLGGDSLAIFMSGGHTGLLFEDLIKSEDIDYQAIRTKSNTRENFIAVDTNTNAQYRFGMPGDTIFDDEIEHFLDCIKNQKADFIVASGSIPKSVPTDFYAQIAEISKQKGSKFVLDTSGDALKMAVDSGVYLLKPNISELAKLIGVETLELDDVDEAALELIHQKGCQIVVVSMGPQGALLVTKDICKMIPAPFVQKKSTVGAGDSMVGGIVWALANNKSPIEAIQIGVACGSAATMNEGTQLFKKTDVDRLLKWIEEQK
jgi:6-phosphofructokinase 2